MVYSFMWVYHIFFMHSNLWVLLAFMNNFIKFMFEFFVWIIFSFLLGLLGMESQGHVCKTKKF